LIRIFASALPETAPRPLYRPHPVTKHRDALSVATYENSGLSHFCDAFIG
jgi:hypothetical protein